MNFDPASVGTADQQQEQLNQRLARSQAIREMLAKSQPYGWGAGLGEGLASGVSAWRQSQTEGQQKDVQQKQQGALDDAQTALSDPANQTPEGQRALAMKMMFGDRRLQMIGQSILEQQNMAPKLALENQQVAKGAREADLYKSPSYGSELRQQLASYPGGQQLAASVPTDAPSTELERALANIQKKYEEDTKRQSVPKFAVNPLNGQVYDTRTGKPAAGGGGDEANPIKQIADGVQRGDVPPDPSQFGMKYRGPVTAELAKRGYNFTAAQNEWKATQHTISTMNGPQQVAMRQNLDAVSQQLDQVETLYGEWQRVGPTTGFKILNRAALSAAKQLPGEVGATAQALDTALIDLTSEFGGVYGKGGSPTDHNLQLAEQNLKADWNPETFKKAIQLARNGVQMRLNALKGVTAVVPGAPGAQAPPNAAPPGAPPPGAPPAAAAGPVQIKTDADYNALPSGAEFIGPDGKHRKKP